jgi:hypothetical protein
LHRCFSGFQTRWAHRLQAYVPSPWLADFQHKATKRTKFFVGNPGLCFLLLSSLQNLLRLSREAASDN